MHVDVRGVDVGLSQVMRGKVARIVRLALGPFNRRIRKVTVRLADSSGTSPEPDHRCQMRVWLRGRGDLHVDATDEDFESAVARAATELARRLATPLERAPRSRRRET